MYLLRAGTSAKTQSQLPPRSASGCTTAQLIGLDNENPANSRVLTAEFRTNFRARVPSHQEPPESISDKVIIQQYIFMFVRVVCRIEVTSSITDKHGSYMYPIATAQITIN